MTLTERPGVGDLIDLPRGSHVCWVVRDPAVFEPVAAAVLGTARSAGEKTFAFAPHGSAFLKQLEFAGASIADPHRDFLGGGPLALPAMFAMFREKAAAAHSEGYAGLRVVADMDWLRPTQSSTQNIVAFETLLDRVVKELGATVICAYRESSFEPTAIGGVAAVHQIVSGAERSFELVAGAPQTWSLSGEVDACVAEAFAAAFAAALSEGAVTIDVSGLSFIDCAGMRVMARALLSHPARAQLRGVPASLRRSWELVSFDRICPLPEA